MIARCEGLNRYGSGVREWYGYRLVRVELELDRGDDTGRLGLSFSSSTQLELSRMFGVGRKIFWRLDSRSISPSVGFRRNA